MVTVTDASKKAINDKINEIHGKIMMGDINGAELEAKDLVFKHPTDIDVLEAMAAVYIELNNDDDALELLDMAVEKKPDKGFSKYLSRAQLLDGEEAVADFQKATDLIRHLIETRQGTETEDHEWEDMEDSLERRLSLAYCGIANEYLCDPDKSQNKLDENKDKIENALKLAKEADESYTEVYTLMATHLIDRGDVEGGAQVLVDSRNIWTPNDEEKDEFSDLAMNVRMALGDVLYRAKLYDDAMNIVLKNLEELPDEIEGHSLFLLATLDKERGNYDDAKDYCKDSLSFYRKKLKENGEDEEALNYQEQATKLLDEIRNLIREARIAAGGSEDVEMSEDEGSEDDDEEDEDFDFEKASAEVEKMILDAALKDGGGEGEEEDESSSDDEEGE